MRATFRCDPALIDRLERPRPARLSLPDWLKTMPSRAYSDAHDAEVRTVKQCPPFVDAMAYGFTIPLPCNIAVEGGRLSWDWDLPPLSIEAHPRSPLSFFVDAQVEGAPFHEVDQVIVKFNCFWTVELEAGWSLFATHPVNREDLPFRTLTGLVDADRFVDVGILFPAVWLRPNFKGILPKGTPVAQCFPVRRDPLEMRFEPMDATRQAAYEKTAEALLSRPGTYRKAFRAARQGSTGEVMPESGEVEP